METFLLGLRLDKGFSEFPGKQKYLKAVFISHELHFIYFLFCFAFYAFYFDS